MKTYGLDAVKLARAYSMQELTQLRQQVIDDPESANPLHAAGRDLYLYTKKARKKLEAIAWAVYHKQQEAQCA